ncbi:UDP-glucose 4-epimerase family protein [Marinobacter salarius]|uniref:UDP-glucose 4-epimerase family protein n=1 Tax=Marinobacter salarius TaxID=1420917 RepID=UPI0032145A2B
MSKVMATGATGFIGSGLVKRLTGRGVQVVAPVRSQAASDIGPVVGDIDGYTDWRGTLQNVNAVVHSAARAHVMRDGATDPLAEFRKVNVEGTLNLARQAVEAGVKRFVYLSSIKVNGEQTSKGSSFSEEDTPAPEDSYGISKMEAEQALRELSRDSDMAVVIVRPPLVYGPGVKGNFAKIIKLVEKGLPLPLGALHNKRSLVALDNLLDLIVTCIDHPAAANQVFLAGDGQDISTTELLQGVGQVMGKPVRLVPVPNGMLMFGAGLLGKKAVAQRLLGSLQVDISKARNLLGWEPPISVEEGLRRCFISENEC